MVKYRFQSWRANGEHSTVSLWEINAKSNQSELNKLKDLTLW